MPRVRGLKGRKANMLTRRRSRRGRRGRRGRRSGGMHYVEIIPISLMIGTDKKLVYSELVNRPKSSNFRIQYVHFVGTAAYDTTDHSYHPSCIMIALNSQYDGAYTATSGPVTLGIMPRNVKVHQPRSTDWCAANQDGKEAFATISAVCIGKEPVGSATYVRGLLHVLVRFGPEMLTAACLADDFSNKLIETSSDFDHLDEIHYLESRLAALKAQSLKSNDL